MSEQTYSKKELKAAQLPHQLFLFNMVGNHILLSIITASNSSFLWVTAIVPVISILVISYTLIRGRSEVNSDCLLISSHWQVVVKRTKIFLIAYVALFIGSVIAWLLYSYAGVMKELAFAVVGGLGILPVMVTVLVLTVMESETLGHALHGRLPASFNKEQQPEES